jgi:peptidoglycan/LPS O-acetylase OafA/YrhL
LEWLFVLVFVALAALAIRVRRAMKDPLHPFGRWFDRHARPRLKALAMAVFALTVIGWYAIYLTAPEGDRKGLTEAFQDLFWQFEKDKARVRPMIDGDRKKP